MPVNNINKLFSTNQFICPEILVKSIINVNLSLYEFLLLVYFFNKPNDTFNTENINKTTGISNDNILESFSNLIEKKLIKLNSSKDADGRLVEIVSVDPVYELMKDYISNNDSNKETIYSKFETEFGRTISPMEYELINNWISTGTKEELILGALKEAVYNGVNNFRYIDKILYEWHKKGFKSMDDIKKNNEVRKNNQKSEELFDYDWLEDEE